MQRSESIGKLAEALSKAQGKMKGAAKDSANPFFKSRYADLASIWDACRDALADEGLGVVQAPRAEGPKVTVTTVLAHLSGEWLSEDLTVSAKEDTPQAIGSAITYCRRYGLSAMVGIAPEDDDGEAAHGRESAPAPRNGAKASTSPAQSAAAMRAKMIWDRAQSQDFTKDTFPAFIGQVLGIAKPSKDWTAEDMEKLEKELAALDDVKY